MTEAFDAYSRYYDLLYADKDYRAEADYVDALLRRHGVSGRDILEFGSGTGKHGRIFADKGYRVLGIERSATMVERAHQVPGFESRQGDIREVSLGRTFDAVLSLFHVISYQVTNADVLAAFARAAEHLKVGGLFLFDVWYSPAVYAQRPAVRVRRIADETVSFTRIAEPVIHANENRVDVRYTIISVEPGGQAQVFNELHPMRHFSLPELDLLARASGFERIAAEGFLTADIPSENTWGLCVVLRRIEA